MSYVKIVLSIKYNRKRKRIWRTKRMNKCPNCNMSVSEFATAYPHCGKTIDKESDIQGIDIKRKFTFVNINDKAVKKVMRHCQKEKLNNTNR